MMRWAAAGASVGAVLGLVLFAPALWLAALVASATDARMQLVEPRGTVWSGDARLVLSGGDASRDAVALPGRLRWRLRPGWGAVQLSLWSDCCARAGLGLTLHPGWRDGRVVVADGHSDWPAGILTGLGAPWNTVQLQGRLALTTEGLSLEWFEGRVRMQGRATLDANDVASRLTTLRPIGSYRLHLSGRLPAGQPELALQTLQGSLALEGRGRWDGTHWGFRGQASAAAEHELVLGNLLGIMGRKQGSRSVIAWD